MTKLLLAAVTALRMAWAILVGGGMDGTAWEVKVSRDSFFSIPRRETLVFEQGRMKIEGKVPAGFEPCAYKAESAAGADAVWNASSTSDEGGTVSWQGLVRGDRIEGVAIWWTKAGRQKRYVFTGSRKNA